MVSCRPNTVRLPPPRPLAPRLHGPAGRAAGAFIAVIGNQPQLDPGVCLLHRHLERNRPHALRAALLAAQRQKHHPLHAAVGTGLHREAKHQPLRDIDAERQAELLRLRLLPPQRPRRRIIGGAAIETHRHLLDQEHEMMAVIHHPQPRVLTAFRNPLQPLTHRTHRLGSRPTSYRRPSHRPQGPARRALH